jgi:REP element-mobilizing transposase RayT
MPDHVHGCIAIPPKHAVTSAFGDLEGKSATPVTRLWGEERNFTGEHFGPAVMPYPSAVSFESMTKARLSATTKLRVTAFEAAALVTPPALRGRLTWSSAPVFAH